MPLNKIMPDDMNEVACAMLAYIREQDRQAGAKMSYGDFGKHLAQEYGRNYHGCNDPNGCFISGTPTKVEIETSEGTKYELTWNKAAKLIHGVLLSNSAAADPHAVKQDTAPAFDYSMLDYDTANYLRKATARIANSYADIGAVLAEAQELLANNKNGLFAKWYTSLGFKKDTVLGYIHIYNKRKEIISSEFPTIYLNPLEVFDALPKSLQLDISSPSAPAEAVNAVLSGDITTHKDFIAMKKELEESQVKIKMLEKEIKNNEEYEEAIEYNNEKLESRVADLEIELKEARSQPQDAVIIPDPKESQEYKDMLSDYNKMHRQIVATTQENDRLKDRCDELSRRNTELKNQPQITGGFDSEQLQDFFEDYYSRANDAVRNLYQFIRDGYPQDIRDYVRGRIDDLKDYIENLEAIHEEDFTV